MHHQSDDSQESFQFSEIIGDFGSLFHVEPTFSDAGKIVFNNFCELVDPRTFHMVHDLRNGTFLNMFKFFQNHRVGKVNIEDFHF